MQGWRQPGASRLVFAVWVAPLLAPGCSELHHVNSARVIEHHVRTTDDDIGQLVFKTAILYPARDVLTLDWLWRVIFGDEAWNAEGDGVADGSFFTNRRADEITPERLAPGFTPGGRPRPPFSVERMKPSGASFGFVGRDADGRRYLFKLDDPGFPELGSAAAVIGARILWALGYNTPPTFVVTIEGTGDARFDGKRAAASAYLEDVAGHWKFDWFRYRREVRGLRIACAWIHDVDRIGTNTLVTLRDGRAMYYLIDFNSCLGAWQGRPKPPWRGWRHASDIFWPVLRGLSLGTWPAGFDPDQPVVSPAVGRFDANLDPFSWRSQFPNTAFDRMTQADLLWIASKIRSLDRPRIEAIVAHARYSDSTDAAYVVETLLARRKRILEAADSFATHRPAR